jgi:hypothetical protein
MDNALQKVLMQRLGELSEKPSTSRLHIHPVYPVSEEAIAFQGNDEEISVISSASKEKAKKVYSDNQSTTGACEKKQSMKTE